MKHIVFLYALIAVLATIACTEANEVRKLKYHIAHEIQYDGSGTFGGRSDFTFDGTTGIQINGPETLSGSSNLTYDPNGGTIQYRPDNNQIVIWDKKKHAWVSF